MAALWRISLWQQQFKQKLWDHFGVQPLAQANPPSNTCGRLRVTRKSVLGHATIIDAFYYTSAPECHCTCIPYASL